MDLRLHGGFVAEGNHGLSRGEGHVVLRAHGADDLALDHVVSRLSRRMPRTPAAIATFIAVGVAIVGVGSALIPSLVREFRDFVEELPALVEELSQGRHQLRFEIEPDLMNWTIWYGNQGYPFDIPAFLRWRPEHFSKTPKTADEKGAFATPRSWEKVAKTRSD